MIYLDGTKMTDKSLLHAHLKSQFGLSDHYGENLDALWDELGDLKRPLEICFEHADEAIDQLGDYGLSFMALLRDLEQSDEQVRLLLKSDDD